MMLGTVYLLHFDPPYRHAGHYIGWALDVEDRLKTHLAGRGSPLVRAAKASGSVVQLARTWNGVDRYFERRLKNQKKAGRHCPICKGGN